MYIHGEAAKMEDVEMERRRLKKFQPSLKLNINTNILSVDFITQQQLLVKELY